MFRPVLALFLVFVLFGCREAVQPDTAVVPSPQTTPPTAGTFSFQVFNNVDSAGNAHGVGYDIYQDGQKVIHQVSIPGEQGNEGFINEEEAKRVAQLVVTKLQSASGFPTVTPEELDSLKITVQSH